MRIIYREPGDVLQIVAGGKNKLRSRRSFLLGRECPRGTRIAIILAVPFWEGPRQGQGCWSWGLTGNDILKLAREIIFVNGDMPY